MKKVFITGASGTVGNSFIKNNLDKYLKKYFRSNSYHNNPLALLMAL